MGLFGKKQMCSICNNNEGKNKLSGGVVCNHCFANGRYFLSPGEIMDYKNMSIPAMQDAVNMATRSEELNKVFSITKQISDSFYIDEVNDLWAVIMDTFNEKKRLVFRFEDITRFELLEDGQMITELGIGSIVAGGLLFGGVGAILGGLMGRKTKNEIQKFEIKVELKDSYKPFYINLLKGVGWGAKVKTDSITYKTACRDAEAIVSFFASIMESGKNVGEISITKTTTKTTTSTNLTDELIKLKELLDAGILSEEEFKAAKEKLLKV